MWAVIFCKISSFFLISVASYWIFLHISPLFVRLTLILTAKSVQTECRKLDLCRGAAWLRGFIRKDTKKGWNNVHPFRPLPNCRELLRLGVLVKLQGDDTLNVWSIFLGYGLHGDVLMGKYELLQSVGQFFLECPACLSPLFWSWLYAIG